MVDAELWRHQSKSLLSNVWTKVVYIIYLDSDQTKWFDLCGEIWTQNFKLEGQEDNLSSHLSLVSSIFEEAIIEKLFTQDRQLSGGSNFFGKTNKSHEKLIIFCRQVASGSISMRSTLVWAIEMAIIVAYLVYWDLYGLQPQKLQVQRGAAKQRGSICTFHPAALVPVSAFLKIF